MKCPTAAYLNQFDHAVCAVFFFVFLDALLVSSTLLLSSTLLSSIHQYTDKNKSVILFLVTRINIAGTRNT